MSEYLFSYGTLRKEKVQVELFGRVLQGFSDSLKGYRMSIIEIKDPSVLLKSEQTFHPIAIRSNDQNDKIEGTVFEITKEELTEADKYETGDYERVSGMTESGKEVWFYISVKSS
jgi:gamma-glutamylcyclotransferase (GGCT)/AIG2-like uncharacterized protein YtfP